MAMSPALVFGIERGTFAVVRFSRTCGECRRLLQRLCTLIEKFRAALLTLLCCRHLKGRRARQARKLFENALKMKNSAQIVENEIAISY
jgi:hypothetical protein